MKTTVVRFKNGKFGVRKGNWFKGYSYLNMTNPRIEWWSLEEYVHAYCTGDETTAREKFALLLDHGTPV